MARIVIAPDSFKGSLPAAAAAEAIAAGWQSVRPADQVVLLPIADGGEGTLDAFAAAIPAAQRRRVSVVGPDDAAHAAVWLDLGDGTAVVELASTSGIELLGEQRRPWDAQTIGFGQAIAAALDDGAERLIAGIGSSASTDGGAGVLVALGARIRDRAGEDVPPTPRGLADAVTVDLSALRPLPGGGVRVLTDVDNPLTGVRGAAHVFGPQKGVAADELEALDATMMRWAHLLTGTDAHGSGTMPGDGAAGGVGFALRVWGAQLVPGSAAVADLVGLERAFDGADLVITGEGSYDGQSAGGKAPAHVAALAVRHGVPIAIVAGRVADDADVSAVRIALSLTEIAGSVDAAMTDPAHWLHAAGARLAEAHL